jgi:Fe-S-cluster containining protein
MSNTCRGCARCCEYEVPLTLLDIDRLASHLDSNPAHVFRDFVRAPSASSGLFSLAKDSQSRCVFLDKKRCSIYQARPRACQLFICRESQSHPAGQAARSAVPSPAQTLVRNLEKSIFWEQGVASEATKAYIARHGHNFNAADYQRALNGIRDNVVTSKEQKLRLARDEKGRPLGQLFECKHCEKRGMCAPETPLSLVDIARISEHLGCDVAAFFAQYIADKPTPTGLLQLERNGHCVFFQAPVAGSVKEGEPCEQSECEGACCQIEAVRPIHCRLTPCPLRSNTSLFDRLYLGSGTPKQQFQHQVALSLTRVYVIRVKTRFDEALFCKLIEEHKQLMDNDAAFLQFCQELVPFRYINDTPI